MDSDASTLVVLIVIFAVVIFGSLIFFGALALFLVRVVRRRREHWHTTATSLGLQSDPMCMHGFRGLPVRIFWLNEGQRMAQMDWVGLAVGAQIRSGGRAGLRYTYCRALLEPPLRLGLVVALNNGAPADGSSIRTGRASFDNAFTLIAREGLQAQRLFLSPLADDFALAAQTGWQLSATDCYVQVRFGGDYGSQVPDLATFNAALNTAVHCGQGLLAARRSLPTTAREQSIVDAWVQCAPRLGLTIDQSQAMLCGSYQGVQAEVYPDCLGEQEWRTIFKVKLPRPAGFNLYLARKDGTDRIWPMRGRQIAENIRLGDPMIEQAFSVCGNMGNVLLQALTPQTRQQLQRLCQRAADVVIEDDKFEASVPGIFNEPGQFNEILGAMAGMASAM